MPLEVLEEIYSLLDLVDKKTFSETCKKFNTIFSDRVNLRNVKLKLDGDKVVTDNLRRTYVNFNCDFAQQQHTVPTAFWERMAPTIRSLRISPMSSFIAAGLSNFANLVYLDLMGYGNANFDLSPPAEPVSMEHLQDLTISAQVFAHLEGNFIKFTTKRLQKVWILEVMGGLDRFIENDGLHKMRSLLNRQTRLKVLLLFSHSGHLSELFDRPALIPSMLDQFFIGGGINDQQALNILNNFVRNQTELTGFGLHAMKRNELSRAIDERIRLTLFDLPLKEQTLAEVIQFPRWARRFTNVIEFNHRLLQFNRPNLMTKKLVLEISEYCDGEQLINYAVKKFPDVVAFEIREVKEDDEDLPELPILPKNLTPVNTLQNLTSLTYAIKTSEYLNSLTIPNLSCFDFAHPFDRSNHFGDLKNFMTRHEKIETLIMHFGSDEGATNALHMLEYVCENSNVKSVKFFIDSDDEYYHPDTDYHQHLMESVCVTVWRYARPGFQFQKYPFIRGDAPDVLKRYDGEVVMRVGLGPWKKVDVTLPLRLRSLNKRLKVKF